MVKERYLLKDVKLREQRKLRVDACPHYLDELGERRVMEHFELLAQLLLVEIHALLHEHLLAQLL